MPKDGPEEPVKVPDGQMQCDDCGAVIPEVQALTKQTAEDKPDIVLCPPCQ